MSLDDPDPKRICIAYLEHVLRARGLADAISGTAQPQITRQGLLPVRFPLPPIDLQLQFAQRAVVVEKLKAPCLVALEELDSLFASIQHRAFRGEL
jgi:type I restriction enzyme S subunit